MQKQKTKKNKPKTSQKKNSVNKQRLQPSIYERILREIYPQMKVYALPSHITSKLIQKFKKRIPQSIRKEKNADGSSEQSERKDLTYFELFRALSGFDYKKQQPHMVFLKGGAVRDIVAGQSIDDVLDIDIMFTLPFAQAKHGKYGLNALHSNYVSTKDKTNNYYYIKVGKDDPEKNQHSVECTNAIFKPNDMCHYEAPMNTLLINISQNKSHPSELDRVYDITGKGWEHAKQHIWTAPEETILTQQKPCWLNNTKLWRMLKFQLRGYHVPKHAKDVIYRYWMTQDHTIDRFNWDNVWKKIGLIETVHDPQALKDNVLRLFHIIHNDFNQLKYTSKDAVSFCALLLNHDIMTVVSRLEDLKKIRTHHRTLKHSKKPSRLSSRINEQSSAYPEIKYILHMLTKEAKKTTCTTKHVFNALLMMIDIGVLTTFHHFTLQYAFQNDMSGVLNPMSVQLFKRRRNLADIWSVEPYAQQSYIHDTIALCKLPTTTPNTSVPLSTVLQALGTLRHVKDVHLTTPIVEHLLHRQPIQFTPQSSPHIVIVSSSPKTVENDIKSLCEPLHMECTALRNDQHYKIADTVVCHVVKQSSTVLQMSKTLNIRTMQFYIHADYL